MDHQNQRADAWLLYKLMIMDFKTRGLFWSWANNMRQQQVDQASRQLAGQLSQSPINSLGVLSQELNE
jgi:hypothetical protein